MLRTLTLLLRFKHVWGCLYRGERLDSSLRGIRRLIGVTSDASPTDSSLPQVDFLPSCFVARIEFQLETVQGYQIIYRWRQAPNLHISPFKSLGMPGQGQHTQDTQALQRFSVIHRVRIVTTYIRHPPLNSSYRLCDI